MDDEELTARPSRTTLQQRRLDQLNSMESGELETLIEQMRTDIHLPRLQLHFREHGHEFGTITVEEYEHLFQLHIKRSDLRNFTFIRPETYDIRWHLVEPATGTVAIYNESRQRYWSFFRNRNVPKFLNGFRGYWIEVFQQNQDWQSRPW